MADKLKKMDFERGKVIVLRTFTNDDGSTYEKEIELDLPPTPTAEGVVKKTKYGPDGRMYETEETIIFPVAIPKEDGEK